MHDSNNSSPAVFSLAAMQTQLCNAFNQTPFVQHCGMQMRIVDGDIQAYIEMQPSLIGNQAFQILHGGVAATMMDSLAGVCGINEIYRQGMDSTSKYAEEPAILAQKAMRIATVDMRVDYISPGRGKFFIGTAEMIRFGRKGCTVRTNVHNDTNVLIATAMIVFAY